VYKAIGVFVFALAVFVGVRWLGVDHAHGPVPDKAVSASQAQSVHSVKQAPVLAEHKVFSHRHSDLQANATHTNSASVLHRGKDRGRHSAFSKCQVQAEGYAGEAYDCQS